MSQFQAVNADKAGTKKLVQTINRARVARRRSLTDSLLDNTFETWWPQLEQKLKGINPEVTSERAYAFFYKVVWPQIEQTMTGINREITNELAYTFFSKVYGQTLEHLVVHATLHEDGSMTVRRQSRLTNYSDEKVATLEQYLFSDARSGSVEVAHVECLYPASKTVSSRIQPTTSGNLTLLIDIDPPLKKDETIELLAVDKTPPGAIALTYEEMLGRKKPNLYECFFWEITRPTKHLEMRVLLPKPFIPQEAEPDVWFGPSRITSKPELQRITTVFKRAMVGDAHEELSLDIMYPVPGFRYAIRWVPVHEGSGTTETL